MSEKIIEWVKEHLGVTAMIYAVIVTVFQLGLLLIAVLIPMTAEDAEKVISTTRFQGGAAFITILTVVVQAAVWSGWRKWAQTKADSDVTANIRTREGSVSAKEAAVTQREDTVAEAECRVSQEVDRLNNALTSMRFLANEAGQELGWSFAPNPDPKTNDLYPERWNKPHKPQEKQK